MKQFILASLLFLFAAQAAGQQDSLDRFNERRIKITRQSMAVLAGWGVANLLYSGIATGTATGSDKYFHQMNLIWGGVNFTLGTAGVIFTRNRQGLGFRQSFKKQLGIEKVYLFNTGLDVAYVVGGFYFKEKAKNSSSDYDRYHGYGNSIILQGAALFLYDGAMYLIHRNHGKKLYHRTDKFAISFAYDQLYCILKF
ncbi:MAG: hypothetical protein ABI683_15995 [Ginsengibacter sp.]